MISSITLLRLKVIRKQLIPRLFILCPDTKIICITGKGKEWPRKIWPRKNGPGYGGKIGQGRNGQLQRKVRPRKKRPKKKWPRKITDFFICLTVLIYSTSLLKFENLRL